MVTALFWFICLAVHLACPASFRVTVLGLVMDGSGPPWGWLTYALVHNSLGHLIRNVNWGLALGIFVEDLCGPRRTAWWYVIATGCASAWVVMATPASTVLVGSSGLTYSLHAGALTLGFVLNNGWIRAACIVGLLCSCVMVLTDAPGVSTSCHVGGWISGCVLGWGAALSVRRATDA